MYLGQHVTVIIPALNEQGSIGRVISDIPDCVDRIIVVDNGSTDKTGEIAQSAGASVICERTKGYGAACKAGINAIDRTELVAFVDGDYSDYPEELTKVIAPVAEKRAAMTVGCRRNTKLCKLPWHQQTGNRIACFVIRLLHGYRYHDLGPMRCIRYEVLMKLDMSDLNYGWTAEMQLKISRSGETVCQIPVGYRNRIGKSKISGTVKGSILAGCKILFWAVRLAFGGKSISPN